jgi:hypothetical protein
MVIDYTKSSFGVARPEQGLSVRIALQVEAHHLFLPVCLILFARTTPKDVNNICRLPKESRVKGPVIF